MRRIPPILIATIAAIALTAAPVAARAMPFHFEYDDIGPEPLCGLDTINDNLGKGSGRAFVDNAGDVARFDIKNSGVDIYTLPSTGRSVTHRYELLFKNFDSVDNGDGTVEGDQTTVGKSTWYDQDGNLLLTENGPITIHLTIDFNVDPPLFTDVTLSQHGHHPDVCPVLTVALGA
jgi:hypothetical protein